MGILATLLSRGGFFAATPDNPTFDINSDEAYETLGGERSITGEAVSAEGALSFSPWFRGVSVLARDVAKTPLNIYKFDDSGDGEKAIDKGHVAYRLLRWKCNGVQTAFQFRQALMGHAVNRGNGYAYIAREGGVEPKSLAIIDPDYVEPFIASTGELWYRIEIPGTEARRVPSADIFHLRGFGFDGIRGYPAYHLGRDAIAVGKAQQKYKGLRFKNAARPALVLQSDKAILPGPRKELRSEWERMHTGLEQSHRTAILDNGLKANRIAFTAEEMQEVEQMALTIRDVSNFLGVPASKMGDATAVKYKSKEDDDQAYIDDALDYWFFAIEDEARDKLFSEREKEDESHCVLFHRASLIRANLVSLTEHWRTATGGRGWASPNEARKAMDMEPVDDPDADKVLTPLNMGQGGAENTPKNPQKALSAATPLALPAYDAAKAKNAANDLLADACRRMVTRFGVKGQRAAAKPDEYLKWLDAIALDEVTSAVFAPVERMLGSLGNEKSGLADAAIGLFRAALADTPNATAAQLPAAVESAFAAAQESVGLALVERIWST